MSEIHSGDALERLAHELDAWLADLAATAGSVVEAAARDVEDDRRWYVRMAGREKEHITIWLHLGQRTLRYEAYVMPAPEENHAALYELMLRRNEQLVGVHFAIGVEDAVFARGDLPVAAVTRDEFDRVIGTLFETVDTNFTSFLRIGYAGRFTG